jgi:tetratricopeptide (TPR) repeat protein
VYTDNRPPPLAHGSFSKKPFPHILVYLMQKRLGGTLEVRDRNDIVTVYFRDGMPGKVRSSARGKGLGQILLDLGLITDEQLKACQREMTTAGGFQGQILMRQGAIDAPTMIRGLRAQVLLKLVDVFAMTDAEYAFYDRVNLLVGDGPDEVFPLDPYPLLLAGVRSHGLKIRMEPVLDALKGRWAFFEAVEPLKRFRLNQREQEICLALAARPRTFEELTAPGKFALQDVRNVLYVALITKELTLRDAPPDAGKPSLPPPQRPRLDSVAPPPVPSASALSPEARAVRDRIVEKAAQLATQNYFEMLELPLGAPAEEVRKAFFKLAKLYHPDRAAVGELADLKETLEYIFYNLSEAQTTLIDPDAREEYGAAISEGIKRTSIMPPGAAEAEVAEALEAEKLFQKGVVLMKRGQYPKALELVDEARKMNPDEGEYMAVWSKLQLLTRGPSGPIDDIVEHLRRAEELAPKSERVHLYLAQALMRADRTSEAKMHFEHALQLNPHNVEAARELRLMEMRRSKQEEKEKKGSFIKKLFK